MTATYDGRPGPSRAATPNDTTETTPMTSIHAPFAAKLVAKHDDRLINDGPAEQTARVIAALERIAKAVALIPSDGHTAVDLAGFGDVDIVYATPADNYVLLSDIAEQLGWPLHQAHEWARLQHQHAVEDQRDHDEERGDGRLGWECMTDYIDLRLDLFEPDPEHPDRDANGLRRIKSAGDWLIAHDRLPYLLMCSPWGREFFENAKDHMGLSFQRAFGTSFDGLFSSDLTEEEALRKARRGPALDDDTA